MAAPTIAGLTLRPITRAEFPEFTRTLYTAFHWVPDDGTRELASRRFEPARSLAFLDGEAIVATAGAYGRQLTVPGGPIPVAAVTAVAVAATHRRRGLLTAMMRRQLDDLHAGGEAVAALWASETAIYQRFGYGMASREAQYTIRSRQLRFLPGVDTGDGTVSEATEERVRPALAEIYERYRHRTPGYLDRGPVWWDKRLFDPESERNGRPPLRFALHTDGSGATTGYAVFRAVSRWDDEGRPDGEVELRELVAETPTAYAALWRYLLSLDLIRTVRCERLPLDEPLPLMVDNPRAITMAAGDQLWLRLVDVDRALAARRYRGGVDVVLQVRDEFCPWNTGRWHLAGDATTATCEPTTAAADLELTSTELGAAYLGGTPLSALARAGRVRELRAGALQATSDAFGAERDPWCPEVF